ncbi:MAG TPA: hypothetical protein VF849_01490 [Blattabacteriaceae bacterium]
MAAKRSRARNFGGGKGGLDLGSLLGGNQVEQVPEVPPESSVTETPYDWSNKSIPTENRIQTKLEPKDIGTQGKFRPTNPFLDAITGGKGTNLANQANIENILAEEAAKRGIRTKQAEIPIDVAKRQALDPLDLAKETQQHIIALLTSQGIQPTPENIKSHLDLTSNIALSKTAQQGYEGIAKSRLGTAEAERGIESEAKTRPIDVDTAIQQSKLGNITAKGNLEAQPELQKQRMKVIPGMAEAEYYKNLKERLFPLRPEESVADIGTGKIAFKAPLTTGEQLLKNTLPEQSTGIKAKLGGPFTGGNFTQPQQPEGSISSDPTNPNYDIIIVGGQKIRVPKQKK